MYHTMADMRIDESAEIIGINKTYSSSIYSSLGIRIGSMVTCLHKGCYRIGNVVFAINDAKEILVRKA